MLLGIIKKAELYTNYTKIVFKPCTISFKNVSLNFLYLLPYIEVLLINTD